MRFFAVRSYFYVRKEWVEKLISFKTTHPLHFRLLSNNSHNKLFILIIIYYYAIKIYL
jgi:hypothetical protein